MVLAVWTADAGRAFADLGLQGCPPFPSFSHFATPDNNRRALARDPTGISWRSSPRHRERVRRIGFPGSWIEDGDRAAPARHDFRDSPVALVPHGLGRKCDGENGREVH
jgi:hypothetical protein